MMFQIINIELAINGMFSYGNEIYHYSSPFETVNKDNVASYRSAISASRVKVIEELENGDLYLEILHD